MAPRPCIFEYVYFARPDSVVNGRSSTTCASAWARGWRTKHRPCADVVVPVPDSGVPAALGYAQDGGLPFEMGIIRNHYVGRTFIQPTQAHARAGRAHEARANRAVLAGKRVMLIDDSIVRGTTSLKIVRMVREAGADRGPPALASPPIMWPDYYGIDMPDRDKLLAANHSLEEIAKILGGRFAWATCRSTASTGRWARGARSGEAAVHRPLLHRRLPDPAHRPDRAAEPAAAVVAVGGGGLTRNSQPSGNLARAFGFSARIRRALIQPTLALPHFRSVNFSTQTPGCNKSGELRMIRCVVLSFALFMVASHAQAKHKNRKKWERPNSARPAVPTSDGFARR